MDIDIKTFRKQTGMSQSEFCNHFGLPVRSLQQWEQGRRTPPPYLLQLIIKVWNLEEK